MFEKVNPSHSDKIADRIAGAIVDLAYAKDTNPEIAVEVLIGHDICHVIIESGLDFDEIDNQDIRNAIKRIAGNVEMDIAYYPQDRHLSKNQSEKIRCGDNGIFKGIPLTHEQKILKIFARSLYSRYPSDGKYVIDGNKLIICQSKAKTGELKELYPNAIVNPLGDWTGDFNVDTGATNRKLGSDMGDSITGGGLHGKDLSKADVSVNIYAFLKAQELNQPVEFSCAIGDEYVDERPYSEIVEIAREYINSVGGFEEFAKWGLI